MIELKHLRKSYRVGDFEQKALDDVSISFRDNEFVAVLGPSGSGKTTLLNILGGLDHADTGELIINGTSTKDYSSADWDTYRNHHIGFIFQSYNLIPHQTVLSNVELALTLTGVSREERRARAMAELERVGLGEHANKKPSQLSGGQMQRVAIARALVNDPDIVLADEPTGALDTETGIQVMDLLSEIASDRLVIMVTHNPELAYDYANRIVKLHDGCISDDSNPFEPSKADEQTAKLAASQRNKVTDGHKKHASMSFLTALALSFNNLMTKKGRTFLTAFAGSIGIIGIAAILALSNGVNNYIAKVEEDTLSSTPLTITQSSFDVTSIMMQAGDYQHGSGGLDGSPIPEGTIPESTVMADVLADVKTNDLKSLRAFFEDDGGGVNRYVNAIVYGYGITPQIYKTDTSQGIKQLNPGALTGILSNGVNSASMFSSMGTSNSFQEMLDDQKLLDEQYDIVAGAWPTSYDECVLVLNSKGAISDYTLYSIGVLDPDELEELLADALASEEMDIPDTTVELTNDEALSLSFKVVNKCNMYTKASSGSTWINRSDDESFMKGQIADGLDLKVVGIVKPNPTASTTSMSEGIGYRHDLVLHLIDEAAASPVVKAQQAEPDIDIFTGKTFESLKNDAESSFDMSSLFSIDQNMMARAFNVDNAAIEAALSGAMSGAAAGLDTSGMFADIPAPDFSDLDIDLSGGMPSGSQVAALEQSLGQMSSGVVMGFMQYVSNNPGSMADLPGAWSSYQQSDTYKAIINQTATGIASGMSGSSEQLQKAFTEAIQKKMNEYMSSQLVPYLQAKMGGMLQSYTTSLATSMASALSAAMGTAISVDPSMFARSITVNMDQDELTSMFMNLARTNDLTYESNLQTLGYADIADPVSINIYAKSFDDKQAVEDIIDQYNADMEASGEEDKSVSYSDIMGVLMSSVTSIVDMISMVLIAFVSISLVVSSIMIGIITYISVLERKKEIGILRAMGASKGNIANIFNAETVIEGLMSGIFAVLLVALVSLPVNAIILVSMNISGIMSLPITAALILILISVFLTFIAGLVPAMNAARRDPVEALRSE